MLMVREGYGRDPVTFDGDHVGDATESFHDTDRDYSCKEAYPVCRIVIDIG